uniref:Guanylate cyclase activator 1d n=1 Tax=Oryzias sinensis TaxID=183150 RepID=A0A8C7YPX5_9TELE
MLLQLNLKGLEVWFKMKLSLPALVLRRHPSAERSLTLKFHLLSDPNRLPGLCLQDGYIDFVEYIAAISLLLKGEINQKLKWYFKLFDQDGNGKIDKDELETIFTAIQDITRNRDIDPEEIVALIFEKIDVKGEGEMTLEEFIDGAKEHPDITEMLKNLMDLTPVLEIIVKGRVNEIKD